jgi:DNA-directed RNA polymerase specialized sigma24 family protein
LSSENGTLIAIKICMQSNLATQSDSIRTNFSPTSSLQRVAEPVQPEAERCNFAAAYEHGYRMTQRFLISRGAPPDAAEEVAQAAWAKGWECRSQLHNPTLLGAWVNSIAKNLLRNRARADRRLERLAMATGVGSPSADDLFVNQLLDRCKPSESTLLNAYYVEGYTTEEIARRAGMTPVTVRVRLLRIRRSLRSRLLGHNPSMAQAAAA